jgi:hypothetical protein
MSTDAEWSRDFGSGGAATGNARGPCHIGAGSQRGVLSAARSSIVTAHLQPLAVLDAHALRDLRDRFLERMPNFGDFTERSSTYWQAERAYKDELSARVRSEFNGQAFEDQPAPEIMRRAIRLLTAPLQSTNAPQNIMSWRYVSFLRHLTAPDMEVVAAALRDLLHGSDAVSLRAAHCAATLWPFWQRDGRANPLAPGRVFPTFFLMLQDPARHIAVRTDLFERASQRLLGHSVLESRPLSATEYENVLHLSESVRDSLNAWAWCPRDLIDVHSFLWVATTDHYEAGVPASDDLLGGTA